MRVLFCPYCSYMRLVRNENFEARAEAHLKACANATAIREGKA